MKQSLRFHCKKKKLAIHYEVSHEVAASRIITTICSDDNDLVIVQLAGEIFAHSLLPRHCLISCTVSVWAYGYQLFAKPSCRLW